jgi:hypothetical protein
MAIILMANKVNLFVSPALYVFWYHSPNFLDTPRTVTELRALTINQPGNVRAVAN